MKEQIHQEVSKIQNYDMLEDSLLVVIPSSWETQLLESCSEKFSDQQ